MWKRGEKSLARYKRQPRGLFTSESCFLESNILGVSLQGNFVCQYKLRFNEHVSSSNYKFQFLLPRLATVGRDLTCTSRSVWVDWVINELTLTSDTWDKTCFACLETLNRGKNWTVNGSDSFKWMPNGGGGENEFRWQIMVRWEQALHEKGVETPGAKW